MVDHLSAFHSRAPPLAWNCLRRPEQAWRHFKSGQIPGIRRAGAGYVGGSWLAGSGAAAGTVRAASQAVTAALNRAQWISLLTSLKLA